VRECDPYGRFMEGALMLSTPIFPLEIEETILDFLAEDDNDHLALRVCSLVCQAFLPICRKHIFGSIILNDYQTSSPTTIHALGLLLSRRPEIANYIRKLDYAIQIAHFENCPSIQESLKQISRLESLTVRHLYGLTFDWSNNPLRPALLHLLHLPTLTYFKVTRTKNFVVSDLIPCTNLKCLHIGQNTTCAIEMNFPAALPDHPIQPNEFVMDTGTSAAIMKLCAARRPDGQPIIDFGSLSMITVILDTPDEGEAEASQELFRRCQTLTDVHISCK